MLRSASFRHAALAVGALLIVSTVTACGGESPDGVTASPEPLDSFYVEARIEANSSSQTESESPFPTDTKAVSVLRWWYEAPDRFRREADVIEPAFLSGSSLVVTVGDEWVSHYGDLNAYQKTPAPEFPDGAAVAGPLSGFILGPMSGGSVEAWVESNRQGSPRFAARLTGTEEMLGRQVSVYEFSAYGGTPDEENAYTGSGSGRIWIDEGLGLVLKYEMLGGDGLPASMAEVTRLDVNVDVPEERFAFNPPDGAKEVEQTQGSIVVQGGSGGGDFPEGFLEVGFVPEGMYSTSGSNSRSFTGYERAETTWKTLDSADAPAFRLRQKVRVTGLPETYRSDEGVVRTDAPHGGPYYVHRSGDGQVITLAWQHGDITAVLDGAGMTLEELLRIATSTRLPGEEILPEG